jgi:hypothetical protein
MCLIHYVFDVHYVFALYIMCLTQYVTLQHKTNRK